MPRHDNRIPPVLRGPGGDYRDAPLSRRPASEPEPSFGYAAPWWIDAAIGMLGMAALLSVALLAWAALR